MLLQVMSSNGRLLHSTSLASKLQEELVMEYSIQLKGLKMSLEVP